MPPPSAHFDTYQDRSESTELTPEDVTAHRQGKLHVPEKDIKIGTIDVKAADQGRGDVETAALESDTTRINHVDVNCNTDSLWDDELSIDLPELELKDSQSLLLLSWILFVYRNTEKNQDSQYALNDVNGSVEEILHDDGENISETLPRARDVLDKSNISTMSDGMILSTVSRDTEHFSQVCRPEFLVEIDHR
jgi:hypothetical protein